jgi:excisionase family DNA binding protein
MVRNDLDSRAASVHSLEEAERLLLSAAEVSSVLGVSSRTVWRLLSTGKLPEPVRIGGSVRWRADEIRSWIADGCPPMEQ